MHYTKVVLTCMYISREDVYVYTSPMCILRSAANCRWFYAFSLRRATQSLVPTFAAVAYFTFPPPKQTCMYTYTCPFTKSLHLSLGCDSPIFHLNSTCGKAIFTNPNAICKHSLETDKETQSTKHPQAVMCKCMCVSMCVDENTLHVQNTISPVLFTVQNKSVNIWKTVASFECFLCEVYVVLLPKGKLSQKCGGHVFKVD